MSISPPSVHDIITGILLREGSKYTNHPADRGGPTKFGITIATLQRHRPSVTPRDVENLTEGEARKIYEADYIAAPGFDKIADPALRTLLIDFGVLSGPARAVKALQVAVGQREDGIFGPGTRAALALRSSSDVYVAVLRQYFQHLANTVLKDPSVAEFRRLNPRTQLEFLRGWINRASDFIR